MPNVVGARPLSRGYQREESVEREIESLLAMTAEEQRRRALLATPEQQALTPECVVHLIREFVVRGDLDSAWKAAETLARRMSRRITRRLALWRNLAPHQREEVEEALLERVYRAWLSLEPAEEFWEVRFNLIMDRALADEIGRVQRRARHEEPLAPDPDGDADPWETIMDRNATSPETAALIAAAVTSLDEPVRTAFWLQTRQEWTEEEIAAHLGCTSRTVRNYLRRAKEELAMWRGTET